jgi:hypothetical protein
MSVPKEDVREVGGELRVNLSFGAGNGITAMSLLAVMDGRATMVTIVTNPTTITTNITNHHHQHYPRHTDIGARLGECGCSDLESTRKALEKEGRPWR